MYHDPIRKVCTPMFGYALPKDFMLATAWRGSDSSTSPSARRMDVFLALLEALLLHLDHLQSCQQLSGSLSDDSRQRPLQVVESGRGVWQMVASLRQGPSFLHAARTTRDLAVGGIMERFITLPKTI